MRKSLNNSLDEQLELEAKLQKKCGNTRDFQEGVLAFHEKRDAKRQEEHKRKWEEALQSDNDMFALNNLSDEELDDYFNQ